MILVINCGHGIPITYDLLTEADEKDPEVSIPKNLKKVEQSLPIITVINTLLCCFEIVQV